MSEFEAKRDKTKAFKASEDTIAKIDDIIKKSGKGPTEFFEELVNDLAISKIVDPNNESISPDLRKHFESDVQKLKNATNSIVSIFVSQMENISVEKNQWQSVLEQKVNEKQMIIEQKTVEFDELKQKFVDTTHDVNELAKVNESTQKELNAVSKRAQDQEEIIKDRTEKNAELQERINKLNENIVDKDEQLKSIEPIKEELASSKQEIQSLLQEKERLIDKHIEEMKKQKETLIFACDKEKHNLETKLRDKFAEEKEKLRNVVRKETEQTVRDFYLLEIQRKELEAKAKEEEFIAEIRELKNRVQELESK